MKKLMIALTAAAAAFALQAAVSSIAGENFNGKTLGDLTAWSGLGESSISSTHYSFGKDGTVGAPDPFRLEDPGDNLAIKTAFSAPAYYSITEQSMAGVYFDSLVKFTACDEDATIPDGSGAKIMVWTKEIVGDNDTVTSTNLMVTAGYFSDVLGGITPKIYDCGSIENYDVVPDGNDWCRLTIKAISDISADGDGVAGFVVFVNAKTVTIDGSGEALKIGVAGSYADKLTPVSQIWKQNSRLFPSLIASASTISKVGFAGQGAVDDVAFYTGEPTDNYEKEFAKDSSVFTLAWNKDDVTAISYTVNGTTKVVENVASESQYIGVSGSVAVSVDVTYAAGKMKGTWTVADDATVDGTTFTTAATGGKGTIVAQNIAAEFNGAQYGTVGEAVTAANEITTAGTYTLALGAACASKIAINNANEGVNIVIDLKGNNVSVASEDAPAILISAGNAVITNSLTTGGIVSVSEDAEANVVYTDEGTCTIQAGQYEGPIEISGAITGGKFKVEPAASLIASGYEASLVDGYYVIVKSYVPAGTGTAEDPYLIDSVNALTWVQKQVAAGETFAGKYLKQTADIALSGEWKGIGAFDAKDNLGTAATYTAGAFQGNFDGDGHTISGLILQRGDYVGFFGSTYGATIKNVKISLGNATGFGEAANGTEGSKEKEVVGVNYGGAAIVGVSVNTTIENCQTIATETYKLFKGTKAIGGIVGYAAKGTVVKGCANNLNLETTNEKCGGIMGIAQNTGNWDFSDVEIDSCTNNGDCYCSTSGKRFMGGLCSYSDIKVIFKGANVVTGALTQEVGNAYSVASPNSGSVELAEGATFTVPAANMTINSGKAVDGLFFATVADGVATLVKNAALVAGGSYKVMAAGAAPTIALAAEESISFDTSLVALGSATGITTVENYEVKSNTVDNVTTYTSTASGTPVTDVKLDITATNVFVDATFTLTATVLPDNATVKTVTWTTSAEATATVVNGLVTAVAAGTATITATAGDKSATCEVTVSAKPTLGDDEGTIETGNDGKATVKPATGVTEVEVKGISGAVTEVAVPKSVEKVKGVAPEKVRVTYTAADAGAKTYDITTAFTKNGDDIQGVTFELNPSGSVEVDGETVPVTPTAIEADAAVGTVADGAVATKAIPGLTYTLKRQTSLAAGAEKLQADTTTAVSGSVSLKDGISGDKPPAAFYTIEVTK